MLDGVAQVGGGSGIVHNQRHTNGISDISDRSEISDIPSRVGDTLAEDGTSVLVASSLDSIEVIGVYEGAAPSKALDALTELGNGSTIKSSGSYNVLARAHQRKKSHDLSSVST